VPVDAGLPCDDGNPCSTDDHCDGHGACAATAPAEVCNAVDDDCDGSIDSDACLAVVHRFYNASTGDHMYKTASSAADPGYVLEAYTRFYLYADPVPGTVPVYQLTNGTDHMLSPLATEGSGVGYVEDALLGHMADGASWSAGGLEPTDLCRHFSSGNGDHLVSAVDPVLSTYGYAQEGCGFAVWGWTFERQLHPYCAPSSTCLDTGHAIPVVTHWQGGQQTFLGTEKPNITIADPIGDPANYQMGDCYPIYSVTLPDYEAYIASNYAASMVSDAAAKSFLDRVCTDAEAPARLLPAWDVDAGVTGSELPASNSCQTQIVHGNIVDGSLATVFLPPNWRDDAPAGTYPIVMNSYYDLNTTTFSVSGPFIATLVGQSGLEGRRGAIGVVVNGGGGIAGSGMDAHALHSAAATLSWVADTFHGDRENVVVFGGSRGGYTSLAIASNPDGYDYRVVLAVAMAPPVRLGDHVQLLGPTFPGLLERSAWSVGLADLWKQGWRYPACAGKPHLTGRTGQEAYTYVLTGTTDPDVANSTRSPHSELFLSGLEHAGTQVYLEVTGHDVVVPHHQQRAYLDALRARGIATEAAVLVRQGHRHLTYQDDLGSNHDRYEEVVTDAVMQLTDPGRRLEDPTPSFIIAGRTTYWRVDRESQTTVPLTRTDSAYPFSMEVPYRIVAGQMQPAAFTGEPGTAYQWEIWHDGTLHSDVSGTLPNVGHEVRWFAGPPASATPYTHVLHIQKPGGSWIQVPSTNTPDGGPAELHSIADEPVLTGAQADAQFRCPQLAGYGGNSYGLSEY
jgi:hypothetical protein